ncbi:hypothetical protein PSZ11_23930, partial [Shigella flexneri]|nr:hypothetical protein [Shigella flexneri]
LDGKALTEIFTQAKARQMIISAQMIICRAFACVKISVSALPSNRGLLDGKALTEIFTQAKARQMIISAQMI